MHFMLSLAKMRKIDPSLKDVPDAELEQIRDALSQYAQLAFEVYWTKKSGSKCPVGLFPIKEEGPKI